ncbi:hypothetical protein [Dyadobacter sp. Leaf189]|uniref:hypothetical protein n=1 Tax=Dyadobacter sp. Leaf189 TaxID=1736295 RepID=UPI0006F9B880|nr:hypothetical protein [Dyadobacter sp. Leaf189]KQS33547.1 hypothetical protein ASG33_05620 [Dyadobacter sp. Leaf189]
MRNSILTFLLLVLLNHIATAQFQAGESFISGSFYNNLNNVRQKGSEPNTNAYNHYINISLGKFTKDNRATGWGLTHSLNIQSNSYYKPDPNTLGELSLGVERFAEFYKSVGEKFALYARPALNLGYQFKTNNAVNNNELVYESKINSINLSAGISAGVIWRLSPKWAVEGGFAFLNPISISYGFTTTEYFQNKYPNGENVKYEGHGINYFFSPNISSGSIGLGLRYFYGLK